MNDDAPDLIEPDLIEADPFEAVTDTLGEAAILRLSAELMTAILTRIEAEGLTPRAAAERARITLPHMRELSAGRIADFSLDALVEIGVAFGVRATVVSL
ncbi:helix-turn-helix domain-containing protein [Gordonia alkaliphila]|uniref:XRE family transcriptional regulator n=1 Tax=Gordonia alkaliphila TaxID=1053547 RepID=UPI001FF5F1C8|nr:XRE family transcriptional regulator [Gordonia alkaliphila]MCK0439958.1 helix-turn-helix domain-containing protein [Gordonia alkaliphila]